MRLFQTLLVVSVVLLSGSALAGSIGSYSGCKVLKGGARASCEKCVGSGSFYQPDGSCGMAPGMHASKAFATEKPPTRPTAMPKACTAYVTIAPGTFDIGARSTDEYKDDRELTDAKVTLTHAFSMKTTEVTQGEWLYILGSVSSSYDKKCGLECPVGAVSWSQVIEYLNALSKKEKLEPCYEIKKGLAKWTKGFECTGYRLPTDAEWEMAARAGTEEPLYGPIDEIAWYSDNSNSSMHAVGTKKKNAFGLYDMLGNVWEWVWDAEDFKPYPDDVTDPIIGGLELASEGQDRVIRGGSFDDGPLYVRASHRSQYLANSGSNHHGFRPVRTVPAK